MSIDSPLARWQSGYAAACKAADAVSIPTLVSISIKDLQKCQAVLSPSFGESTFAIHSKPHIASLFRAKLPGEFHHFLCCSTSRSPPSIRTRLILPPLFVVFGNLICEHLAPHSLSSGALCLYRVWGIHPTARLCPIAHDGKKFYFFLC